MRSQELSLQGLVHFDIFLCSKDIYNENCGFIVSYEIECVCQLLKKFNRLGVLKDLKNYRNRHRAECTMSREREREREQ